MTIIVGRSDDCTWVDASGHDREYVYIHPLVTDAQIREAVTLALSSLTPQPLTVTPEVAEGLKARFKSLSGCDAPVSLITGPNGIKMVQHDDLGQTRVVTSDDWGIHWNCTMVDVWTCDGDSLEEAMSGPA